jgi:putative ABC transport system permease protein
MAIECTKGDTVMKGAIDISFWELILSFGVLLLPILLFLYYRISLIKDLLISAIRMVVQMSLIAVYLEWIFIQNNAWLNILWVFVMLLVSVFSTIKRAGLHRKYFVVPLLLASFTSVAIIDAFFLGFVLKLEYIFDAQYFIPITGMIIGNALKHNIVGLTTYFNGLKEKTELYQFLLTNSGSSKLALRPFIADAIKHALNPMIATMAVMGLISLPGMMTGQILGGSSPTVAIKYQVMIMLAIFAGCTLNLFLSIVFSNRFAFDAFGNFRKEIIKTAPQKRKKKK